MQNVKVVFMGTPDFSVPILDYLINNTNVVLVVTQPDKEVGRDHKVVYSPVKKLALENNIDVFQPERIRKTYKPVLDLEPDLIITCAFGQILPKEVLDAAKIGAFNIHASLLPKYRGSSPIQAALLNGDKKTGVSLMYMDEKMDTGDVVSQIECDILKNDNVGSLHDKLSLLGVEVLKQELSNIVCGKNNRVKQEDELASYTKMIERSDEHISFDEMGENIINKVRAFNPWPLAYFTLNGWDIKVYDAFFEKKNVPKQGEVVITKSSFGITCKDGIIYLQKIKPFGKKEMDIKAFINGLKTNENYEIS